MMRRLVAVLAALLPVVASAEAPRPVPRPVISEIVSADPTRQRAFDGVIEAKVTTVLAFQTIGRIATLPVSAGDIVSRGQVLATLDRVSLQDEVDAARAALSAARAQADYAEQSLSRAQTLNDRGIASVAQLEQAQAARDAAVARVDASAAGLARAQEALGYSTLTAPADAVVLDTHVEQGAVVSAGTKVLTLAGLHGREAVIDVPSSFLPVLTEDAVFTIAGNALGSRTLTARLRLVEPVADESLRSRRVRLTLDETGAGARIGSLITATRVADGARVVTLPQSAVADGRVWRVTAERHVQSVPVTLGAKIGSRVVVTDGLSVGDEIVVKGAHSLVEGQQVGERIE